MKAGPGRRLGPVFMRCVRLEIRSPEFVAVVHGKLASNSMHHRVAGFISPFKRIRLPLNRIPSFHEPITQSIDGRFYS